MEAFRHFWFTCPIAVIMLMVDVIIAIIYTSIHFYIEWRNYHRGPRK